MQKQAFSASLMLMSSLGTALAFSSYVLALIAGLVASRRLADTANRRTVLLASVVAAALATAGLAFALRGSIDKVTSRVFLLTPADVEVSADDARRLAERGLFRQD